jgi:hypothetical protein
MRSNNITFLLVLINDINTRFYGLKLSRWNHMKWEMKPIDRMRVRACYQHTLSSHITSED